MMATIKLFAIMLVVGLAGCADPHSWPHQTFETAQWFTKSEAERYVLVKDLIERKLLIGKSRDEVVAILHRMMHCYATE
jgi:hypothetical protein